jgi:hypothetical protein
MFCDLYVNCVIFFNDYEPFHLVTALLQEPNANHSHKLEPIYFDAPNTNIVQKNADATRRSNFAACIFTVEHIPLLLSVP